MSADDGAASDPGRSDAPAGPAEPGDVAGDPSAKGGDDLIDELGEVAGGGEIAGGGPTA